MAMSLNPARLSNGLTKPMTARSNGAPSMRSAMSLHSHSETFSLVIMRGKTPGQNKMVEGL